MRNLIGASLVISLLCLPAAQAQQRAKVQIDYFQVGFTTTAEPGEVTEQPGRTTLHKAGAWAPVYVWLRAGPEGLPGQGEVVVETADSDDIQNTYTVPLPAAGLAPDEAYTALTYTKSGSTGGDLTVRVRSGGRTVIDVKRTYEAVGPGDTLYLVVGGRLPGLRKAFARDNQSNPMEPTNRVAHVDDALMLPTRWFGYGAVDLMILTTGNGKFVTDLMRDDKGRREALAEWVRRGGRLVVSCGRNQDMVRALFDRLQIPLAVDVREYQDVPSVDGLQAWGAQTPLRNKPGKGNTAPAKIPLATLEPRPGQEVERLLPTRADDRSPLLLVRWPYGLGQVTLAAFDLDQPAFTDWPGQGTFWKELSSRAGLRRVEARQNNAPPAAYSQYGQEGAKDLATRLQDNLEVFKDVSVISFGWVALFILIYIVIVGPLDYFFLKKVVKRLELTWITFPTVVLVVSAGAYFTAYALKGNDLKINKVDLVDIDLPNQQAYGTTWFTLFSPRIQLYTVGVEPAAPVWAREGGPSPAASVLVSWMGRPEMGYGGFNRPRSQSLFHRTYEYAPDAAGLSGVPIQVWSTKSFTATWERAFRPGNAVPQLTRNEGGLVGTLANPLPVTLEDAVLIHGEGENQVKVYVLGTLAPDQRKPLVVTPTNFANWQGSSPSGASPNNVLARQLMFSDTLQHHDNTRDNALHYLDQSWRRNLPSEAMLVGRLPRLEGPAEQVTQDPGSPSRLWLGQLPTAGTERPPVAGTLTQDTYVRVFLHVDPPASAGAPGNK